MKINFLTIYVIFIAGQQHPRLARGESYTCGYKPYRCEICNYSTTTKGNLSIHMQSDKHLNNMQELNNTQSINQPNVNPEIRENPKIVLPSIAPPNSTPQPAIKPKPSFRCDVCSYETSVARNLRIHMTSEKHTHNMAVLQNNIKHLQALNFLQTQNMGQLSNIPNMPTTGNSNSPQNIGNVQNFLPEAALADLAYSQALLIQMLQHNSGVEAVNSECGSPRNGSNNSNILSPTTPPGLNTPTNQSIEPDQGLNPDSFEPPIESDLKPKTLFTCLVCSSFHTNTIDDLNNHIIMDRSRTNSNDIMIIVNSNYICRLCNYKTNLKANFQLHCKTDKHIQKLNYINHIKEGGSKNEYKLKYNTNQSVQLKCNCCDYYTNSIQKLNVHIQNVRHENMKIIFNHLLRLSHQIVEENLHQSQSLFAGPKQTNDEQNSKLLLTCKICNFKAPFLLAMIQHIKSLRHMQIEQVYCVQRRAENMEGLELFDVFNISENSKCILNVNSLQYF